MELNWKQWMNVSNVALLGWCEVRVMSGHT